MNSLGSKRKNNKFDIIQFILVLISVLTMVYATYYLVTYYFDNKILVKPPVNYNLDRKHLSPNEIGDSIGGILNPIIGISGSILTFLAFYIQYKTNKTQVELFNENQVQQNRTYEKDLFFRLIDNLNNKIFNSKIAINYESYEGFSAIDSLNKLILKKISDKLKYFGRDLLQHHPNLINENYYSRILNSNYTVNIKTDKDAKLFKDRLIATPLNERAEHLKLTLNNRGKESEGIENALEAIGGVYFYKVPFDDLKESFYSNIYYEIYKDYSTITDGYTRSFNAILNFIETADDKDYYYSFLQNSLSNQELCLIFYYCSSTTSSDYFREKVKEANILTGRLNKYDCFIDSPSNEELEIEIGNILNIVEVII